MLLGWKVVTTGILRGAGGGEDRSFGVLGGVLGACMNASDKTSASDNAPSAVALLKRLGDYAFRKLQKLVIGRSRHNVDV